MLWIIVIPLYLLGMGTTFAIIGHKTNPNDYWDSPAPFFGSLVWPIFIPIVAGGYIGQRITGVVSRTSRDKKRRLREIAEAEHKARLSKIEIETLQELERVAFDEGPRR